MAKKAKKKAAKKAPRKTGASAKAGDVVARLALPALEVEPLETGPELTFEPVGLEPLEATMIPESSVEPRMVALALPCTPYDQADESTARKRSRIDVELTRAQAAALHCVKVQALLDGAQLAKGRYVSTPHDAMRLILERIARAIGALE